MTTYISETVKYSHGTFYRKDNRVFISAEDRIPLGLKVIHPSKRRECGAFQDLFGTPKDGWSYIVLGWAGNNNDMRGPIARVIMSWLDRKLTPPMVQTMLGPPRKNPGCKDPMCSKRGIRKDMRMGKLLGGGPCYCNCVTIETVEKNRYNRWRRWVGLEEVK